MGASDSKDGDKDGVSHFTEEEKCKIHELFTNISIKKHQFTKEDFLSYCKNILRKEICEDMFNWMVYLNTKKEPEISYQHFIRCLGKILRGTVTDNSQLVLALSSGGRISCNGDQLVVFVETMLKSFLSVISHTPEYNSWQLQQSDESVHRLAMYILENLFYSGSKKDKGMTTPIVPSPINFSVDQIEDWLSKSSTFLQIMDQVFSKCFNIYSEEESTSRHPNPKLPVIKNIDWSKFKSILDLPSLIYLNSTLPLSLQSEWRLLFSNYLYGDSFVQLVQRVLSKGPTLVLVKDKAGHIFGGFAGESLKKNSNFYGDEKCYLYQLKPHLSVYTSTGYNNHYLYFNQHVQTLPNGLGFGGQFDYFGLWIDHSFTKGHSKAGPRCTTYGSPQLSVSDEFEVDTIEVWAVGPEPKSEEDDGDTSEELASRKSILDKDPAAKAMLSLIGKAPHSEGLREADETADSPEEHTVNTVISLF